MPTNELMLTQDDMSEGVSGPLQLQDPVNALTAGFLFADGGVQVAAQRSEILHRQGFHIGNLNLMIRYEDGSEITELPPLFRLPNAPSWFRGMVNLHGMLLPVFDLAVYFGVASEIEAQRMLLVLGHGASASGILIDGLPVRLQTDSGYVQGREAVPHSLRECVENAYQIGDTDWLDFRYSLVFDRLEEDLKKSRVAE